MAFIVISQLTIRAETVTGMLAPEGTIVAMWDRGVPHSFDVQTFPAQIAAAFGADSRQTRAFTEIRIHF